MLDIVKGLIKVSPNDAYNSGVDARFMKINDQWGFKFFTDKYTRDKTHKLQKKAHKIGCAPEIGTQFTTKTPDGNKVYGYITECVTKLGNEIYRKKYGNPGTFGASTNDMNKINGYKELIEQLKTIMDAKDMHGGNVGTLANGKMVAIDFSFCTE